MAEQASDPIAEQAILATLFNNPEQIDDISTILDPDQFFEPRNEIIYETILKLHLDGLSFNPVSVYSHLKLTGDIDKIGGIQYLSNLVNPTELAAYGVDPIAHAASIKDYARRRELLRLAETIQEAARPGSGMTADEATVLTESAVFGIVNNESASAEVVSLKDLYPVTVQELKDSEGKPTEFISGIPTGFPALDEKILGFRPGALVLVGARPATGKTTIAVDFCRSASFIAGKTVLFFSLEMGRKELMERILSAEGRIELTKIRTSTLSEDEWMEVHDVKDKISNGTFLIDDTPNVSLTKLRSISTRQIVRPEGLDMIVVDYLQLMEVPKGTSRSASRQEQVSELSRGLKLLAKELQVPIIVLAQLNRGPEQRSDRAPQVSDLRESGSLEQDADIVLLLHRPEQSDPNNRPGETDLIIGKNRGGPNGKIPLTSMLAYSKFVPGTGIIEREAEMVPDQNSYQSGDDEAPW